MINQDVGTKNPKDLEKLGDAVEEAIAADTSNPVALEKRRIQELVQAVTTAALLRKVGMDREDLASKLYDAMPEELTKNPEVRVMEGQCLHLAHQWIEVRAESRKVEEPRWVFIVDVNPLGIHVATDICPDIHRADVVVWEPWSPWQAAYIGKPLQRA